jgi:hypothetical protein
MYGMKTAAPPRTPEMPSITFDPELLVPKKDEIPDPKQRLTGVSRSQQSVIRLTTQSI